MVAMANGLIVGAYAAHAPGADTGSSPILRALAAHPDVAGLEVPQVGRVEAGADWKQGWSHVITAIPGTMQRIAADPTFGLASPEETGRAAALTFAAALRDDVDFPVPAEQALHTLEVLDAARTSAAEDRVVDLS